MKNVLWFLVCLCVPIGTLTASDTEEVWITIGSDAMEAVRAEFTDREWNVFAERHLTNPDISVMKVTERQIIAISRLMHNTYGRCGGLVVHPSYEMALASAQRELSQETSKMVALNYTLDRASEVNTVLGDLGEQNIINTITSLANFTTRYYTSQSAVDSANWLKGQWESMATGRSDISVELYNHSWAMPSVVMTITGAHQPQDIVVMGGHLDSINQSGSVAPGADDDASGIATLTEIMRAALANGYTPARTIKVIGYAAEEVGLRGSGDIASEAQSNNDNIIGVLQLDMTNYKGSTQDIWLMQDYTNAAQNSFVENLIDTYTGATRSTSSCGYGCSDHASWHNRGFPTSMPFESHINQYNPNIHTANDTLAASGNNAAHAMKFARLGVSYLIELGKGGLNGSPGTDPGPVGGEPPTGDTELTNGVTLSNLSGAASSETHYYIDVPAGASNLVIATSGGSGDSDLYTKFGVKPTTGSYDCRPYENGNNETCTVAAPSEGRYYVMLRAYSAYSAMSLTASYTGGGGGNNAPNASFSHSVSGLTASFSDNSSDSDGNIASWSWNFGDSTSSSAQSPNHTYTSSGTYSVVLTVTDNDGATDTANASVTVAGSTNNAPSAAFTHSTSDLTASFSDGSSDSDGSISSWSWNFGDGNTSTAQNPSHTYGSSGTYTVTLNVTDNDGASDSTSATVSVSAPPGGNVLSNGQTVSGLGESTGNWVYYTMDLPAGASNLSFTTSGGSGDTDLHVRFGAQPTTSTYDCRPYKNGNNETCSFASPSAGTYHIGLRAYSTFAGVSLTGSYTEPGGGGCDPVSLNESSLSASTGNWVHYTLVVPDGCSGTLTVNTSGGSGDGDLYVRKGAQPTTSSYDCRPYKSGNSETCTINGATGGTYHISVRAYSTFSGLNLSAGWQ